MCKRYLFTVEYDGTAYCGWQKQNNGLSVQEVVERAIFKICGEEASIVGSGRTDAGVHACAQVFHTDLSTNIPYRKLPFALNTALPDDIKIKNCRVVNKDFNARFSAKEKTYIYKMYISVHASALRARTHLHVLPGVDAELMKRGAEYILGRHDFKCFLAANSQVKDTVREVYSINFTKRGDELTMRITGNGFLYNMVRIIVGTLLDVGYGKIAPERVKTIIESGERKFAGKTVAPQGLYLYKIKYKKR